MPDIDRLVRSGVSHSAIRDTLAAQNLEVSAETFKKNLARWRRQNVASPQVEAVPPPPAGQSNGNSPEASTVGERDEPEIPAADSERPFDTQSYKAKGDQYLSKPKPLFGTAKP